MKAAVIVFPGSNCDRDVAIALEQASGRMPLMVWHQESALPPLDLIVLPGGFSFGDYLRTGAIAAHSPVMRDVVAKAKAGVAVLGICNGFQILTEAGLLPGGLARNSGLKYVCRDVPLRVERTDTIFTSGYQAGQQIRIPVSHGEGNFIGEEDVVERLEKDGRVVLRYLDNPNGSMRDIAGIVSESRRVMGLMPHPERMADPALGGSDGKTMFEGLTRAFA